MAHVYKSDISLTNRCYGNKNGRHNRLKIKKIPFWSKFETFDRAINIEHKQIPKRYLTDDENYHGTQHIKMIFWYLAVLISYS